VVSRPPSDLDDRTAISPGRQDPLDDRTLISGGARTPSAPAEAARPGGPAPGRLSGGRVAVVPGDRVERYTVRADTPPIDNVVRTVIAAPVAPTRQSRSTATIEASTRKKSAGRGLGLIIGIVAVTVGTLVIVAGVVVVLFVL
jgi:hypothetical protein